MDELKAEIEKLRLAREAATLDIVEDLKSEMDKMKEARENEYANILGDIKNMKYDSKLTKYKLTSAIKHTSHIHTSRMNEIKEEIQKLHTSLSTSISASTSTSTIGLIPLPVQQNDDGDTQSKINFC
jgi:gas vesicle protein